jgi:hypothetical protein
MNVSIHNIKEVRVKHEHHWADQEDMAFFILRLAVVTDKGVTDINLFSSKPIEVVSGAARVIE